MRELLTGCMLQLISLRLRQLRSRWRPAQAFGLSSGHALRAFRWGGAHGFRLRCATTGAPVPGKLFLSAVMAWFLQQWSMGAAIYLALVGGGLTAAFLLTVLLRGIRLI